MRMMDCHPHAPAPLPMHPHAPAAPPPHALARAHAQVDLLPLPANTPESIPVVCCGRFGEFLVRSQRVVHEGEAHTASRFEALCGRGDAKKWKNSLWWVHTPYRNDRK